MLDQKITEAKRLFAEKRVLLEKCNAKDNLTLRIDGKNLKSSVTKDYKRVLKQYTNKS